MNRFVATIIHVFSRYLRIYVVRGFVGEVSLGTMCKISKCKERLARRNLRFALLDSGERLPSFSYGISNDEITRRHASGHVCYVLRDHDQVVVSLWIGIGCVHYTGNSIFLYSDSTELHLEPGQGWLYDMISRNDLCGLGLATSLLNLALADIQRKGITRVTATVGHRNLASIGVLTANGFILLHKVIFRRIGLLKFRKCRPCPVGMATVVHLIHGLCRGGAERVVLCLQRVIDPEKYRIEILHWDPDTELLNEPEFATASHEQLHLRSIVSFASVITVARMIRKFQAHVLHTHLIDEDLIGFFAAKIARVPHVCTIHSYPYPAKRSHALRYRLMSFLGTKIICVSATVKRYVADMTGINPNDLLVVPNGIDIQKYSHRRDPGERTTLRQSLGLDMKDIVIGNVSRLIDDKGHENILRAAPTIKKKFPLVKFLIVGAGPLRDALLSLRHELGADDYIVFAGSRSDIPELLDCMDMFLFPTFREALGLCVLEAMAMGKPIVASDDAAIPELIESGKEGLLIQPGNEQVIIDAVCRLLADPQTASRMGKAACERAQAFSLERMTGMTKTVYDSLVTEK